VAAALARIIVFPLGRPYEVPSDRLGHEVASLLIAPSATRDRLTDNVFLGSEDNDPVGLIERALDVTIAAEPIHARIRAAVKAGKLDGSVAPDAASDALALRAVASGLVTADEARVLAKHHALVARVIAVDDFDRDLGASLLVPALQALQRQAERMRAAA
jgi:acyl-CoA dehydrogenase